MTKTAKLFSGLIIVLGVFATAYSVFQYGQSLARVDLWVELQMMLCLIVLCTISRSLPISINRNYQLDVSILSIVAAVLAHGPYAAVLVYLISSLFSVSYDDNTKARCHVYNTRFSTTAFNNSNLVLAILLPGMLILRLGFTPGVLTFPYVIWPMILFTLLTYLMNSVAVLVRYLLDKKINLIEARDTFMGLLPNVVAAMPLGLLTGILFTSENGNWMAVIMLLPLLLARYAWKLYLDSQVQYYRLIQAFVSSMEAKDKYTEGHSRRVNQYAELVARALKLNNRQVDTIRTAALLHDIGKIGVPDGILLKPSRLTDDEFAIIQRHPEIGVSIVERVGLPKDIVEIIRHHHERYDGKGYPDGLTAAQISLAAQILTVADAYDAMTSERPYRKGMPQEVAFQQLIDGKDTQFNPYLVDCLIQQLNQLDKKDMPDGDIL